MFHFPVSPDTTQELPSKKRSTSAERSAGGKASTAERLFGARSRSSSTGEDVEGQGHQEVKGQEDKGHVEVIVPHILPPSGDLLSDTLSSDNEQFEDAEPFAPREPSKSPLPIESPSVAMEMCRAFIDDIIEKVESIQNEAPPSSEKEPITDQEFPSIIVEGHEPMKDEESRSTWMQLSALIDEPLSTVFSRPSTPASHVSRESDSGQIDTLDSENIYNENTEASQENKMEVFVKDENDLMDRVKEVATEEIGELSEEKKEDKLSDECVKKYLFLLKEEVSEIKESVARDAEELIQSKSREKENENAQSETNESHKENKESENEEVITKGDEIVSKDESENKITLSEDEEKDTKGGKIEIETEQAERCDVNEKEIEENQSGGKEIIEEQEKQSESVEEKREIQVEDDQSKGEEENAKEAQFVGIEGNQLRGQETVGEEKDQSENVAVKTDEQFEKEDQSKGKEMVEEEKNQSESTEKEKNQSESTEKDQSESTEKTKDDSEEEIIQDQETDENIHVETAELKKDIEDNEQFKSDEIKENVHGDVEESKANEITEEERKETENVVMEKESAENKEEKCPGKTMQDGEEKEKNQSETVELEKDENREEKSAEKVIIEEKNDSESEEKDEHIGDEIAKVNGATGKEINRSECTEETKDAQQGEIIHDDKIESSMKELGESQSKMCCDINITNEAENIVKSREDGGENRTSIDAEGVCDEKHEDKPSCQSGVESDSQSVPSDLGQPQSDGLDSQPIKNELPRSESDVGQPAVTSPREIGANQSEVSLHSEPDISQSEGPLHAGSDKSESPECDVEICKADLSSKQEHVSEASDNSASSRVNEVVKTPESIEPLLNPEAPSTTSLSTSSISADKSSESDTQEKSDLTGLQGNSEQQIEEVMGDTSLNGGTSAEGSDSETRGNASPLLAPSGVDPGSAGKPTGIGRGQLLMKLASEGKFVSTGK